MVKNVYLCKLLRKTSVSGFANLQIYPKSTRPEIHSAEFSNNCIAASLESTFKHLCQYFIRSFSGLYFPAFGQNTDQKNFEYGHFSCSVTGVLLNFSGSYPTSSPVPLVAFHCFFLIRLRLVFILSLTT